MLFRRRSSLAGIDETTPHRFAIVIEPGHVDRAAVALDGLSSELTLRLAADRLIVASTRSPRTAAVLRPLNALRRAAVSVNGVELLDVVELTDRRAVEDVVDAWKRNANRGPARRRAESVGGTATLDLLQQIVDARDQSLSGAARFVFGCAVFNTAGSEYGALKLASRSPVHAAQMVGWVLDRCWVAELTRTQATFAVDDLLTIVRSGGYAAERALSLVAMLPEPLEPAVRVELIRLADGDGDVAASAVRLLGRAEPDAALRALLDRLVADSSTSVRAAALAAASQLWGCDLRPVWHEWLGNRSAPLRQAAEEMLGAYGDTEDLDVAAAQLAKLIRRRPGQVSWHVPREAPLIELALRHRGQPPAEAALTDLFARWSRLNPDIHDWFGREHPDLVPVDGALPITSSDDDAALDEHRSDIDDDLVVDDVMWPLPTFEITDDTITLRFDETDMFETKERFEELCAAQTAVKIIEADRERLHLHIDHPDPTGLITQLWARAGGNPVR